MISVRSVSSLLKPGRLCQQIIAFRNVRRPPGGGPVMIDGVFSIAQHFEQVCAHRFKTMMLTVFYPMNHEFLIGHNGAKIDHYWANWDLANVAAMMSIGVLADRRDIYSEAIEYFKHGAGNGSIEHTVWMLYPNGLGQVQESGRDQGHTMLDISLLGVICQTAWNQGDDLFGYEDNRVLRGAEYAAQYNLGEDVP